MQDENFEFICVDIAERETDVVQADLKRDRGVAQFGADVEGFSKEHAPILVISAKRYQKVTPASLLSWGTKFLDSYETHWAGKGVQRFVIAATVEFNDDDLNEAIREEKKRFSGFGIAYEAWGLRQLTNKLRNLPRVVATYMHPGWVPIICDPAVLSETAILSRDDRVIANVVTRHAGAEISGAVGAIKERYGREIGLQLEAALSNLSQGRTKPLEALVARVRDDLVTWDSLDGKTKGKILRSASTLALRDQNVTLAKTLQTEAAIYHSAPDRSSAALLMVSQGNAEGAIKFLASPKTPEEVSIYAGVLIEEGRLQEARQVLKKWPVLGSDASEPRRLEAFADVLERNDEAALAAIRDAEALAPSRYAVQWAGAVIRFNAALSPQLRFQGGSFPNPISPALIKEDDDARKLLEEASQIFRQLAESIDVPRQVEELEIWRLASLVCHSGRSGEAETVLKGVLSRPVPHPGAIAWAVQFGMTAKPDPIIKAYTRELAAGKGTSSQVVVAAFLMLQAGNRKRALTFLTRWRAVFDQLGDLELIDHWISQITEIRDAANAGGESGASFQAALKSVYKKRDASQLLILMDTGDLEADQLLAAFQTLLAGRMWREANDRRELLRPFRTASAVEMMAVAACEAGSWEDCIGILEAGASLFPNSVLPRRLRLLEADAKTQMGRPDLALKIIEEVTALEGESSGGAFRLAWLRLRLGDVSGAAMQIKGRAVPDNVGIENILHIAQELRHEHPELARSILENVPWAKLEKRLVTPALALASELGLAEAQRVLFPKVAANPQNQLGSWNVDSLDEMLAWIEENRRKQELVFDKLRASWLDLGIPHHLLFEGRLLEWAHFFHQPFQRKHPPEESNPFGAPFLLRSGHSRIQQDNEALAATIAAQGLIVDASALLIAAELGLIDEIDHLGCQIMLAQEVPEILRATETALTQNFRPVSSNALHVDELIRDGEISVADEDQSGSLSRLVLSSSTARDGDVTLPELLHDLCAQGLDRELATAGLGRLELDTFTSPTSHRSYATLQVGPRELVILDELNLLTPIRSFVSLFITEGDGHRLRRDIGQIQNGVRQTQMLTKIRELVGERLISGTWTLLPKTPRANDERMLRESGPLLRGLLSVLHFAERQSAPPVWVEDRYLSRFGALASSRIVGVPEILNILRVCGRIDDKRASGLMRTLSNSGYGFLLPRTDEIVDVLLSAPMGKRSLTETDRLVELRTTIAWQLEYARHLKDVPLGSDTTVGSERLFLSKLMQLAGKVIAEIWSRNVQQNLKVAASAWAWQHLRIEQVDYLPIEDQSPTARENFVFLQYAGLASAVFSISGTAFKTLSRVRKQFLRWAFSSVLDEFASSHAGFDKVLVNLSAQYTELLFGPDVGGHEEDYAVRVAMARDYVNCFPKPWNALLQEHPLLNDKLKIKLTEIVTIGDLSFNAELFFAAVKDASSTGTGKAHNRNTRRQATFTALKAEEAGGAFAFSISDRKSLINVGDDSLAMLIGDENRRVDALMRHPAWFDRTGQELENIARKIATLPSFQERRDELQHQQESTVVFRLEKLASDIREGTASPNGLLVPISPASLQHFLRLPQDTETFENLTDLATSSFRALSAEVGALRALRRVAAIPVDLPADINLAIAAEARALSKDDILARVGPTPLATVALWKALCDTGEAVAGFDLSEIFEDIKKSSVLFVATLQLAFRSVAGDAVWNPLMWQHAALLWCHANSILDVLLREHVVVLKTAKLLNAHVKSRLDDAFEKARVPGPQLGSPGTLRPEYFCAAACWRVWDSSRPMDRTDENLSALRLIVARRVGRHFAPSPDLLTNRAFVDADTSWFSKDVGQELQALSVIEIPPPFDLRKADAIASRLIEEIAASQLKEGDGNWSLLWLCEPASLSIDTLLAIRKLQTEEGLISIMTLDGQYILASLVYRAQVTGLTGDHDGFLSDLRTAARQARKILDVRQRKISWAVENTPQYRSFTALVEAIWTFASHFTKDFNDVGEQVKAGIAVLAEEWPESRFACLDLCDVFARQMSTAGATPIWDLINKLRRS